MTLRETEGDFRNTTLLVGSSVVAGNWALVGIELRRECEALRPPYANSFSQGGGKADLEVGERTRSERGRRKAATSSQP